MARTPEVLAAADWTRAARKQAAPGGVVQEAAVLTPAFLMRTGWTAAAPGVAVAAREVAVRAAVGPSAVPAREEVVRREAARVAAARVAAARVAAARVAAARVASARMPAPSISRSVPHQPSRPASARPMDARNGSRRQCAVPTKHAFRPLASRRATATRPSAPRRDWCARTRKPSSRARRTRKGASTNRRHPRAPTARAAPALAAPTRVRVGSARA